MQDREVIEQRISRFFNAESSRYSKRQENNGLSDSMKFQVESLVGEDLETILDVGSGPGNLLLELAKKGNSKLIGLDLSEDMIAIAKQNIEEEGFSDRITLKHGSLLDANFEETMDGISLHRVLCCHPDRVRMLESCQKLKPRILTICVPRDWKILRGLAAFLGGISRVFGTFRIFVHSQKSINKQLEDEGYKIKDQLKGRFWVTTTYELKE